VARLNDMLAAQIGCFGDGQETPWPTARMLTSLAQGQISEIHHVTDGGFGTAACLEGSSITFYASYLWHFRDLLEGLPGFPDHDVDWTVPRDLLLAL
jgi:hypothetical protein